MIKGERKMRRKKEKREKAKYLEVENKEKRSPKVQPLGGISQRKDIFKRRNKYQWQTEKNVERLRSNLHFLICT